MGTKVQVPVVLRRDSVRRIFSLRTLLCRAQKTTNMEETENDGCAFDVVHAFDEINA